MAMELKKDGDRFIVVKKKMETASTRIPVVEGADGLEKLTKIDVDEPLDQKIDMPHISPIVEEGTFTPAEKPRPKKIELKLITKEELKKAIIKLNKKDAVTEDFAVLMTPKVKRSVNLVEHQKWDIAHGHVRKLMKILAAEKFITWKDISNKKATPPERTRYVCNLVKQKEPKAVTPA